MNILLTGATGFLGCATHKMLGRIFPSAKVIGVSRRKKVNANDIICDLSDEKQVKQLPTNIDCIIHTAAYVPAVELTADVDTSHADNPQATLNLLEFAARHKISNVILASSSAVYGTQKSPIPLPEKSKLYPENFYALSKLSSEIISEPYNFNYDMTIKTLRFSYIYGIGMRESTVICKFIDAANTNQSLSLYNDGRDFFDFLHISDAVEAIYAAIPLKIPGIYNIGSGYPCTLNELSTTILNVTSSKSSVLPQPPQNEGRGLCLDLQHTKNILNWSPKVSLVEGIRDLANFRKISKTKCVAD